MASQRAQIVSADRVQMSTQQHDSEVDISVIFFLVKLLLCVYGYI